jgi:RNA polymerase sigma-70 factor (ECF subfamily)
MRMKESERTLVEQVLSGRAEAFEPLVAPYRQALLGLAFRLVRDMEEAKDAAQEALLKAYRHLGGYDPDRSFRNWLFEIAANAARDRLRMRGRERRLLAEYPESSAAPDHTGRGRESAEFRADLARCLDVLTPREREVFLLRDVEELNIRETARALGCTNLTVRVSLSAARRKIREAIRTRYPHLEDTR